MDKITTVLIADSSEEFCSQLAAALQRSQGFGVVGTATDGEQVLRLLSERKVDALVLDLMLPKRDGISILKAVAAMEKNKILSGTIRVDYGDGVVDVKLATAKDYKRVERYLTPVEAAIDAYVGAFPDSIRVERF